MEVAVVIPCFNEAAAIGDVVRSWRGVLPDALDVVLDPVIGNNLILRAIKA